MSRARENGNSKRDMVNYRVEILRQFLVVYNRKTARIARARLYEAQSETEMDRIKMSMIDAGNVLSA